MKLIFSILILCQVLVACRKGPGTGGNAVIRGRVYEYDYNSDFSSIKDEYFIGNQEVFIVYGDNIVYDDKFKTHYDGTFEFRYLLPGQYTIYTYTKDRTGDSPVPVIVQKKVHICNRWDNIDIDTLIIYK
jgi:hypothetical protein